MTLNKGYRNVYDLNIHLVLVTKYRRKVIDRAMLTRLEEIFRSTCSKWRSELKEFNGEEDHVHLLISYPPDVEVSKFVNNLKTVSSRLIRKDFLEVLNLVYNKPVFWSGAYFVASAGGTTIAQLKVYVESQQSPE
ncbi:MAG: IS200/IS605 family transposase [Pegethrix bostrychoides GSE-TBD4-15B]|jgi:putative transposase|uniref:IS200/IS605 family transposase n=1 Tax=Pegethrix bostrychoides GSE-TBD4-15B TaxID=2839662 RepID=A0A951P9U7_9CYAN|nr:IS200/IS605 family transposase [Pegethrix bostrychoides GSE-TBD4-15B]